MNTEGLEYVQTVVTKQILDAYCHELTVVVWNLFETYSGLRELWVTGRDGVAIVNFEVDEDMPMEKFLSFQKDVVDLQSLLQDTWFMLPGIYDEGFKLWERPVTREVRHDS